MKHMGERFMYHSSHSVCVIIGTQKIRQNVIHKYHKATQFFSSFQKDFHIENNLLKNIYKTFYAKTIMKGKNQIMIYFHHSLMN